MSIIRLEKLLKNGTGAGLQDVVQRAQHMGELTIRLRTALAADLGAELLAANVRDDGDLVLVCSSPAWAARLRFESEALRDAANEAGFIVKNVRVKVARGE